MIQEADDAESASPGSMAVARRQIKKLFRELKKWPEIDLSLPSPRQFREVISGPFPSWRQIVARMREPQV
jgi:hypothetical protein